MESLKLKKFNNFAIKKDSLRNFNGGDGSGSSRTEECGAMTGLLMYDTQTDHYSDECGDWSFVGSTTCQKFINMQ